MQAIKITLSIILFCLVTLSVQAQYWSLTGNTGVGYPANFLGTKDNRSLVFKTTNIERMRIWPDGKISIGVVAPLQQLDVKGSINISSGSSFYIDNHKLITTDLSNFNLFLGTMSGVSITGTNNTSAGNNALYALTKGNYNTALGTASLFSNTLGSHNTAVGNTALTSNTTGFENTAIGKDALNRNTLGYSNTAIGLSAQYSNISGTFNTSVGWNTLFHTETSQLNTAIGIDAGASFNNGNNNTFIGAGARATLNGITNSSALGALTNLSGSNQVRIGNASITSIGGYVNWSNISDGRVKRNIKQNVPGLAFINKLKPVTYNIDLDAADKILLRNDLKNESLIKYQATQEEIIARKEKQQIVYTGFVAQEVEKAARELNYSFSGVDAPKNDRDIYALRYSDFVVPLVKAVQELSKANEEKDACISELKKRFDKLEAMINTKINSREAQSIANIADASLEQNTPNPFHDATKISYTLPQQHSSAKIIITNKLGKTIKAINITGAGKGSVIADASLLASGAYYYSLFIDGKLIDTKQMENLK